MAVRDSGHFLSLALVLLLICGAIGYGMSTAYDDAVSRTPLGAIQQMGGQAGGDAPAEVLPVQSTQSDQ